MKIGIVYSDLQVNLEEGMKELLEVEKYVKDNKLIYDKQFENLYGNIGSIYSDKGENDKALEF